MALFFGDPAQMPIFSIPSKDSICRAARVIFNLPKDMRSSHVLEYACWRLLNYRCKLALIKLMHEAFHHRLPQELSESVWQRHFDLVIFSKSLYLEAASAFKLSRSLSKMHVPHFTMS